VNAVRKGSILAKDLTADKVKARPKAKNPVKICDTTFRDGHQSGSQPRREDDRCVDFHTCKKSSWIRKTR